MRRFLLPALALAAILGGSAAGAALNEVCWAFGEVTNIGMDLVPGTNRIEGWSEVDLNCIYMEEPYPEDDCTWCIVQEILGSEDGLYVWEWLQGGTAYPNVDGPLDDDNPAHGEMTSECGGWIAAGVFKQGEHDAPRLWNWKYRVGVYSMPCDEVGQPGKYPSSTSFTYYDGTPPG